MIVLSVIQFYTDHYICGNTFRSVWALREYLTATDEQAKEERLLGASHTDITALLYERAAQRYRTLEIRNTDFRTEEMQEILDGRNELEKFDEELYRRLIKQIEVYKDNTVKVVFLNGSSIKTGYAEE